MTNSPLTKFACILAAFGATVLSFSEVARADTVEFAYSQRELATAQGVARLDRRIKRFAYHACRFESRLLTHAQRSDCRADIERQLRGQIFTPGTGKPAR